MDAVTINGKTRTHDEWDAYVADERRMWEDALTHAAKSKPPRCQVPPEGWMCTRPAGHDGPCAAWPQWGALQQSEIDTACVSAAGAAHVARGTAWLVL